MHKIRVEKPKGNYRVTVETPSGKKDVKWVDSKTAIMQLCEEYMVPFTSVKWEAMK